MACTFFSWAHGLLCICRQAGDRGMEELVCYLLNIFCGSVSSPVFWKAPSHLIWKQAETTGRLGTLHTRNSKALSSLIDFCFVTDDDGMETQNISGDRPGRRRKHACLSVPCNGSERRRTVSVEIQGGSGRDETSFC